MPFVTKEDILEEIKAIRKKVIIVEGKKDKRALVGLGCKNIVTLEDSALFEVVEAINAKEVVVLTDLDKEGRELYHKLKKGLVSRGVKIDDALRLLLFKAKVSHIEGLGTFLDKIG